MSTSKNLSNISSLINDAFSEEEKDDFEPNIVLNVTKNMEEEENNEKLLTIVPSPLDDRDWVGDSIYHPVTYIPEKLDLRNNLLPIRNQGPYGTCAAQSAACMKEWQEKKDINFENYFSPQFIYNLRENSDSEGMYGRDVMKILNKYGICPEEKYEYGKLEDKNIIINNEDLIKLSVNYKIKNYAKLFSIDATKKALYKNGPCLICFPVYNNSVNMWIPNFKGQKMQGGHAMTIVGYTKDHFIIRNSWGEKWGHNGYCYYSFNEWGSHWEIWTTIDDKSHILDENNEKKNKEEGNNHKENNKEDNNKKNKKKEKRERTCPFWFW